MKIIINGEVVEVGGGGGSEDVYSTEETRIGTWIDGKPLYRRTFNTTTGTGNPSTLFSLDSDVKDVVARRGHFIASDGAVVFFPVSFPSGLCGDIYVKDQEVNISLDYNGGAYFDRQLWLTLEYTKTTDQAESAT